MRSRDLLSDLAACQGVESTPNRSVDAMTITDAIPHHQQPGCNAVALVCDERASNLRRRSVMSFYLRTSVKVGPVRVNMSRTGLGASVGVPGFRLGAGPRGTYVSLGGDVVSYRATVRSTGKTRTRAVPTDSPVPAPGLPSPSEVVLSDVSGATALEMTEVGSSNLITQLNDAARSPRLWPWCLALTVALMFVSPLVLLAGAPLTVWLFWKDEIRRKVVAFYDVHGEEEAQRFQRLVDAFSRAGEAQCAWHVIASGAVSTTHQHKVNAGASALINRLPLTRGISGPPILASNIVVPSLSTARRSVYFLPDRILIRDGKHYADVAYRDSRAESTPQRFIEDGSVPSDSELVGHTWRYVNVKGGPDRRFKNNRQLPILRYGRLNLLGKAGYQAIFDFSTTVASSALANALTDMATSQRPRPQNRVAAQRPAASRDTPRPKHRYRTSTNGYDSHRNRHSMTPTTLPLSRRRLSAEGRVPVVGESHYQPALGRLANGAEVGADFSRHLQVVAILVPEPENPHDNNAVRVDVATDTGTATVGYLSRHEAPAYQAALLALRNEGYAGTCPGRITGGGRHRFYGMYLHLAGANTLLIENLVGEVDMLDPARQVTVTKEEDHQTVLSRHHSPVRACTRVAAQLVSSTVSSGKHKGAYAIEVRLDGNRVGELTAAMSTRYQHLVTAATKQFGHANCEALITHGTRGFQIDLRLPTTN
jgi:hypothetical protein